MNGVDVLVARDSRLKDLIGDVTHHALVSLRCELLRDAADIAAPCNCQSRIWFKTPQDFRDEIDLISKNETGKFVPMQKPWMKHISKFEKVFRSFNHDYKKKTVRLMSVLDKILQITDFDPTNMAEISLSLPGNNDVSPPDRPRKSIRLSSFKKDFSEKSEFLKFVPNHSFGFVYEDIKEEMLDLTSDTNLMVEARLLTRKKHGLVEIQSSDEKQ
ncbi:hypothetical protein BDF21DRAFT_468143 [Thamnidium elegans]|nr:hypothetical protein BDF21DRAFT_468143 [Thamnidium elegans]